MKTLGVVLAGGKSSRFGSDKAAALLSGRPLIAHVLDTLRGCTDAVGVVGRTVQGVSSIQDRPAAGLGPLGGLCGALCYAAEHGFGRVLSCGVDCPTLPVEILGHCPAYLEAQPVIGLWPTDALAALLDFLATDRRRSVRGFAERIGAVAIRSASLLPNINTPQDLALLQRAAGGKIDAIG